MTIYYIMTGKTNTTNILNTKLLDLVNKGMNANPTERYKDVEELLNDFKKI